MKLPYRSILIQKLIDTHDYKSYLEIGIDNGNNFKSINCETKVSVDPAIGQYSYARPTYCMTSDQYFKKHDEGFDIIFIDGLHESAQVYRDIINSLTVLNENGTIICHDMNPAEEIHQVVPRHTVPKVGWNGDCWKAWVKLRCERSDLNMLVVDSDHGLGIIKRGTQQCLDKNNVVLEYQQFDINRNLWLNLTSQKQYEQAV